MKKICCLYKIINKLDNKFYLGSTIDFDKRVKRHQRDLRLNKHHNIFLQRAFNKHGEQNFSFHIFKKCSPSSLKKIEQRHLDKLDPKGSYNVSGSASGGDLITNHPNREELVKNATKTLVNYNKSDRARELNRQNTGTKNPNFGNKWSKKARIKASKNLKEIFKNESPEKKSVRIDKIKKSQKKHWESEEGIKKRKLLSKKNKGKGNHFFGKKHSKKTKQLISKKNSGPNLRKRLEVTIEGITYDGLTTAAKALNVPLATVCYRLNSTNPIFVNWNYFGEQKEVKEIVFSVCRKVRIGDAIYNSIADAARSQHISIGAIVFRIKSTNPKWADHQFVESEPDNSTDKATP